MSFPMIAQGSPGQELLGVRSDGVTVGIPGGGNAEVENING
jgi:hypothetical protein